MEFTVVCHRASPRLSRKQFHLGDLMCGVALFVAFPYSAFYLYNISSNVPFPHSFLLIGILSLFHLVSLANVFIILVIFSENRLLVSLISLVFLFSLSLISTLVFIISLLLLGLGLVCSLLKVKV